MTANIYEGMPGWMVKGARRRALRDRDEALLAALPPLPAEEEQDDEPPMPRGIDMPAVTGPTTLWILVRRAVEDERLRPFAVKHAGRLGLLQHLPIGWADGQVVNVNQRTIRLGDDGELSVHDYVGTDARRASQFDDPDEGTELDEASGVELDALISPPEPPVRLVLLPGAAEKIHKAAFPAAHRPGKVAPWRAR